MNGMMESFWGKEECNAPSTATRRILLLTILRTAYRPQENDFYDINTIKTKLLNTIPKQDWGMIWCK
jgi:hypothetical protein